MKPETNQMEFILDTVSRFCGAGNSVHITHSGPTGLLTVIKVDGKRTHFKIVISPRMTTVWVNNVLLSHTVNSWWIE